MYENNLIKDDFKKLLLSDKKIKDYFLISLLHKVYKKENPKEHETYYLDEYEALQGLIQDKQDLNTTLSKIYDDTINTDMINDVTNDYLDLSNNEGINLIYGVSRLLYLQDKYKDDEIGEKIDAKIKEWLEYIKTYDEKTINNWIKQYDSDKEHLLQDYEKINEKMRAYIFHNIIPSINYDIANIDKHSNFMDLQNDYDIPSEEMREFLINYLNNKLNDAQTYNKYTSNISHFINEIETDINFNNFINDEKKAQALIELKKKYNILDDDTEPNLTDDEYAQYENELIDLFRDYLKDNEFNIQTNEDIKNWRDKADKFIQHLKDYEVQEGISLYGLFTTDYMLKHLAYSDYQREAYKLNLDSDIQEVEQEQQKKISAKELKEKYKDTTLLNGRVLNPNKQWGLLDTSKANTNIINMREIIGKKVDSDPERTQRKINKLKSIKKPTKQDLNEIKELETLKKEQEEQQQKLIDEINDLQADIDLINDNIIKETNGNARKKLIRQRSKIDKILKEKKDILNNKGVMFQLDINGKLVYEKTDRNKKESYKLMINADYDIQNFNQEGRNFLQYIPNIDNVVNQLNEDYITIDLDDYITFNGLTNPSRTRQRLLNTLKEMRKESYEYSYIDEKGALQEGSLVLIGDVMTTEYKGKNTLKVQLGGQFKRNIQEAIVKGQIAHVNKEVFKLGHGKNNKKEYMAKELYLYFVRLARTEAKKGLIKGDYVKSLKISTIIDYLIEINLLKYNPNRYSESVKEPLQLALYMGQELGLYDIHTDAFKYYDDVISALNKGANVKDKIEKFENSLIEITLHNNNTDLESNEKARKTYEAHKKKRTTKNK